MTCSSCGSSARFIVVTVQHLWGRTLEWLQCFVCHRAEHDRHERERNERPVVVTRGRR